MYKSFLLLAFVLFFVACSGEQVAEKDSKTEKSEPVKKELTAAELAAIEAEKKQVETERIARESAEQLKELNEGFAKANAEWMETGRSIKDQEARQSHFDQRPCLQYAEDVVALAEMYPETEAADDAWRLALKWGLGEPKLKAGAVILDAAKSENNPAKVMESLEYLMKHAFGDPQKEAMEMMLEIAKEDIDSEASFEIVKKLVSSPRGIVSYQEGYLLPGGNEEVRGQAIKQLKLFVQANVKSDKAIECLNLMYGFGTEDTKEVAFGQLLKHHTTHEKTMGLVRALARNVSAKSENLLKELVDHPNEIAKANAMVTLAKFYSQKQLTAQYYESAPPEHLQGLGEERAAYLKTEIDPEVLNQLETMLSGYVEDHDSLLEAAKRELFAMQNLAVGKTAPNIVGKDLDGVEFKLSDYRGKVVFLDFWGDW